MLQYKVTMMSAHVSALSLGLSWALVVNSVICLPQSYLQSLRERQMGTGTSMSSLGTANHANLDYDFETGSTVPLTAASPVVRVWRRVPGMLIRLPCETLQRSYWLHSSSPQKNPQILSCCLPQGSRFRENHDGEIKSCYETTNPKCMQSWSNCCHCGTFEYIFEYEEIRMHSVIVMRDACWGNILICLLAVADLTWSGYFDLSF